MSELVPHVPQPVAFLPGPTESERLWKLANAIATTDFVPKSIRGNPPAILAAMMTGRELGILPMRALRQINVIDGRPAPSPELMMALALKAGHDVFVAETTRERCAVEVRRSDWDGDRVARLEWTLEDAADAGLCTVDPTSGKAVAVSQYGRPLPWQAYTRAMLRSRAISEACRTWLPDVVEGASYAPEELGADVDDRGHSVELVEVARAGGREFDPLEGETDEVRVAVAAAMGDGLQDAEIVDEEAPADPGMPADVPDGDLPAHVPAVAAQVEPDGVSAVPGSAGGSDVPARHSGSDGLTAAQVEQACALIDDMHADVATANIDECMARITDGSWSAGIVMACEMAGKKRTSLLARLQPVVTADQKAKARTVADVWLGRQDRESAAALVAATVPGTPDMTRLRDVLKFRMEVAVQALGELDPDQSYSGRQTRAAEEVADLGPWGAVRLDRAATLVDELEAEVAELRQS